MLDHRTITPKSKNERHAAWERFGAKRNERHAAWERFSCFYGPVGCLQEGPPKMRQTTIFKRVLTFSDPTDAEVTPSDLSATLHGNAIVGKSDENT